MLQTDVINKVGVITLDNGKSNPINPDLIKELEEALDGLQSDKKVRAVVLSSKSEKFFSNGFDLPHFYHQPEEHFKQFFRAFDDFTLKLYALPKPTIAAINGHAVAGGCVLAICCDYRIMAKGNILMGLNEVKLGVPVPYPADLMLHQKIGTQKAQQMLESGNFYPPEHLMMLGLVDQVSEPDMVLAEAIEKGKELANHPPQAFAAIKANRTEQLVAQVKAVLADKQEHFFKCWYSKSTQKKVEAALLKF